VLVRKHSHFEEVMTEQARCATIEVKKSVLSRQLSVLSKSRRPLDFSEN